MRTSLSLSIRGGFVAALFSCLLSALVASGQLPNAWQIKDNITSSGVIQYQTNLTAEQVSAAVTNGWHYTLVSRMVSTGGGAAQSMAFGDGAHRFYVFFNLDGSGRLTAQLLGDTTYTLTDAAGGTNYHTHEMTYDPVTSNATYRVDGVVIASWPGEVSVGQSHLVMWGANASSSTGVMNYHYAGFDINGEGVIARYDAGFEGNPVTAPSPTTQGWLHYTGGAALLEGAVSPDAVALPPVLTLAALDVTPSSATLNAQLHPDELDTMYWFEYGLTTNYGSLTSTNTVPGGTATTNVTAHLSALSPATTYHFRAVATNSSGVFTGADLSFTTPVYVTTLAATAVTPTTATLNALLHPDELVLSYYWEYGPTTNYGSSTLTNVVPANAGAMTVSTDVGGLSPGATYHFRCVAANTVGVADGQDMAFVTPHLFTVTSLADSGAGSLRQAIADAGTGDFIEFTLPGVIALTGGQLTVAHDLTIDASALASGTTIDAGNLSRILNVGGGSVTVDGLLLTNGYTTTYGGAIEVGSGASLTLNECTIANCSTATPNGAGGAIDNSGVLSLSNCTLSGNSAGVAGALNINPNATATINGSTLSGNSSTLGGAIWNEYGGVLTMNNSTMVSNITTGYGGAIYSSGVRVMLNNCTVSANSADIGGGLAFSSSPLFLTNTIVADNTAPGGPANVSGGGGGGIGNSILGGDPKLAPLGYYGGPTQTMPPLAGSPAIDAGLDSVTNFLPTDQRGQARLFSSHVDIGAAEFRPFVVLNPNDSGPGSLRGTLPYAPDLITFAGTLAGQTIFLTSGELAFSQGLTIDASSLPGGVTISGNHSSRVLEIGSRANVFLDSLTLRDGVAPGGGYPTNCGGAILNLGKLVLDACTLQDNQATNGSTAGGGAIENAAATLAVTNCLFTVNSAANGGAIENQQGTLSVYLGALSSNSVSGAGGAIENGGGTARLDAATLSGNTAATGGGMDNDGGMLNVNFATLSGNLAASGGGIENGSGTLAMNASTLSGNSVENSGGAVQSDLSSLAILNNCTLAGNSAAGYGGGIDNNGVLAFTNTIVAGNSAPMEPNLYLGLFSDFSGARNLLAGDPLLSPLGDYGGPTQTLRPLSGAPAIDAGLDSVTNSLPTDQRGYPRLSGAHVDIGAVELQLVTTNNPPLLSNPVVQTDGTLMFSFAGTPDADFTVLAATNVALPLAQWTNLGAPAQPVAGQYQFTDPGATNYLQRFYRVVSP